MISNERVCSLGEVTNLIGTASVDFDFDEIHPQEYNRICQHYLRMFREEYAQVAKVIKPKPKKHFLFEVMCSKESELTRQGMQQGLLVKQFSTKAGRRNSFCHLASDRPKNIWITPTCGPWCQWSSYEQER